MSSTYWIVIGICSAIFWIWLIWEAFNAPIMPDDYDTPFEDNGSDKKKQYTYDKRDPNEIDDEPHMNKRI